MIAGGGARAARQALPPAGARAAPPARLAAPVPSPLEVATTPPQPRQPSGPGNAADAARRGEAPAKEGGPPVRPRAAPNAGNAAMAAAAPLLPPPVARLVRAPPRPVLTGPLDGLAAAPPSQAAVALAAAEGTLAQGFAADRAALAVSPPRLLPPPVPTENEPEPPAAAAPAPAAPAPAPASAVGPPAGAAPVPAEAPAPTAPAAAAPVSFSVAALAGASTSAEGTVGVITAPIDIRGTFARAATQTEVDTSAGERPPLTLADDLDPARAQQAAAPRHAATAAAAAGAAVHIATDPGVGPIAPDAPPQERIATMEPGAAPALPEALPPPGDISTEVAAGFDSAAAARWMEANGQARADHEAAVATRSADEARAWRSTEAQIAASEAKGAADQRAAIGEAEGQAAAARSQWAADIESARGTYAGARSTAITNLQRDADREARAGEANAARELEKGEAQAREEEAKTRRNVAAEQRRVEQQSEESGGFLDWLASKVEDLFDALADFINDAFDALRSAVRGIIDGAKWLARKAINAARDLINGFIDLAAGALELAADVFLAAFPEARDRARAAIRDARDAAKGAVNNAADWLITQVDRLLDALGAALDFILAAYQKAYLAILNAFRALVLGFIEIMRGIARLVEAARAMPPHFEGAVEAEIIGQDLTKPLPFERGAQEAGTSDVAGGATFAAALAAAPVPSEADRALLSQQLLSAGQVTVDEVADFTPDPAFLETAMPPDGGEVEFGGTEGPEATAEAAIAEAYGGAGAAGAEEGTATEEAPAGPAVAAPGADGPTAEEDTEKLLQQLIDANPEGACEAKSAPTGGATEPPMRIGPLTRGQRARYLVAQMGKGIRQWFSCNWPWLLAATVAALVGIIALEIVTGGLITAALPVLLEILAVVMIGAAVAKAASHFGDYLSKGWAGDVQGGARSLAKGLAIGAVELIFAVLTYITAGAFRALAAVAKGAGRALGAASRGAARLAKAGAGRAGSLLRRASRMGGRIGRVARTARVVVVRGRLVYRGLRRGFARGVNTLDDLAARLGRYYRFRRYKLRRIGRRLQVWGLLNPWILLADGSVVEGSLAGTGRRPRLGAKVVARARTGEQIEGILVGVRNKQRNAFLRSLDDMGPAEADDWLRRLRQMDEAARRRAIANISETAENARILRAKLGDPPRVGRGVAEPGHAAHHIVPSTHSRESADAARKILDSCDIHFNDALNGVYLPPSIHRPLHTNKYMDAVLAELAPLRSIPDKAIRKREAAIILDDIADRILRGHFPP